MLNEWRIILLMNEEISEILFASNLVNETSYNLQ